MLKIQASKEMLDEMQQQMDLICSEIKIALHFQKSYADSHQSDREFQEGDMVFL